MKPVVLYTKDYCPYCHAAKALLDNKKVSYTEFDVQFDAERLQEMLARSNGRKTVPQIFIGEQHIGGFDDMNALNTAGDLDALLQDESTTNLEHS
ncbi:MAG: glutaredoxin 3 [Pseudomonadota bacterium]